MDNGRLRSVPQTMKLATYRDGSRDGQLVLVSRDLSQAHYANGIATRLQEVLDDWNFLAPQLQELSQQLNQGRARHAFAFEPGRCMAPLPRTGLLLQSNAYAELDALLRQEEAALEPQLWRSASESLQGAQEPLRLFNEAMELDFQPGLFALCGDIPQGAEADEALSQVRLLMPGVEWTLRQLAERERGAARGARLSQLALSLAPVAATPDEFGEAWRGGRLRLNLQTQWNGRKFGVLDAGSDMRFAFGALLAQAVRLRPLPAGSMVGTGVVGSASGKPGPACIAQKRLLEQGTKAGIQTGFMEFGDSLRLDMKGLDGHSVCGAIDLDVFSQHEALPDPDAAEAPRVDAAEMAESAAEALLTDRDAANATEPALASDSESDSHSEPA